MPFASTTPFYGHGRQPCLLREAEFSVAPTKAALPIQPQTNAITAITTQPRQAVYYVPMATTRRKVGNSAVQTVV